MTVICV